MNTSSEDMKVWMDLECLQIPFMSPFQVKDILFISNSQCIPMIKDSPILNFQIKKGAEWNADDTMMWAWSFHNSDPGLSGSISDWMEPSA